MDVGRVFTSRLQYRRLQTLDPIGKRQKKVASSSSCMNIKFIIFRMIFTACEYAAHPRTKLCACVTNNSSSYNIPLNKKPRNAIRKGSGKKRRKQSSLSVHTPDI